MLSYKYQKWNVLCNIHGDSVTAAWEIPPLKLWFGSPDHCKNECLLIVTTSTHFPQVSPPDKCKNSFYTFLGILHVCGFYHVSCGIMWYAFAASVHTHTLIILHWIVLTITRNLLLTIHLILLISFTYIH